MQILDFSATKNVHFGGGSGLKNVYLTVFWTLFGTVDSGIFAGSILRLTQLEFRCFNTQHPELLPFCTLIKNKNRDVAWQRSKVPCNAAEVSDTEFCPENAGYTMFNLLKLVGTFSCPRFADFLHVCTVLGPLVSTGIYLILSTVHVVIDRV